MTDAITTEAEAGAPDTDAGGDAGTVLSTTGDANGNGGAESLVGSSGSPAMGSFAAPRSLDMLHGVEMTVTVELGRTKMLLGELLALRSGSIIELDRAAGSPVDVLINGTLLAHGEVVVVDDEFGVRITGIVSGDDHPVGG